MTIASEITRLQNDKAAMCAAIENKGVTMGAAVSLDDYASCIAAIPTGSGCEYGYIDLLVVGGGGGGGGKCIAFRGGGGGGGGGFVECTGMPINICDSYHTICVGGGGEWITTLQYTDAGNSSFDNIVAYAGGRGGTCYCCPTSGASGGGGSGDNYRCCGCPGCQGGNGGNGYCGSCSVISGGGGGGGACGNGCNAVCKVAGNGGAGACSCISGSLQRYSGGGGGGTTGTTTGTAGCGGGNGGQCSPGCDATGCGGGGGGSGRCGCGGGKGGNGVVILRYHTNGSDGISCTSSGGTKYTCGDYTIHCFTTLGEHIFCPAFS